jgi:Putative transposase DNA-binding domain
MDTGRTGSQCGHCEKGNRGNQSDFGCRSCGHQAHADINAAENIRQGRCKEAEYDVVQNRLSHSFRFRRLQPQSQALAFRRGWLTADLCGERSPDEVRNLGFPFLLGRTGGFAAGRCAWNREPFPGADRTNRSWDGPSSNWSRRGCCQPGP